MARKPTFLDKQYNQYGAEIENFIAKYVDNKATAEDLTHEVFTRAQHAGKGEIIEKPRAYLFAAARNHLIDHFRKRERRRRDDMLEYDDNLYGNRGPSEERRLEARDELRRLTAVIGRLPPRVRQAFVLSRIYRFSYAEVGKMMGISPHTVENHVAKGLHICTRAMSRHPEKTGKTDTHNITDLAAHRK